MSDEQRREKRIPTRQRLWCEGQESPSHAETRDVSHNGMFIVAEDAPEVGSQLKVTLQDEAGEVTLNMEVMWKGTKTEDNKTGVGVRIVGFDKGRDVYEKFINRHLRPSTAPGDLVRPTLRPSGFPARDSMTTKPRESIVSNAHAPVAPKPHDALAPQARDSQHPKSGGSLNPKR